MTAQTEWGHIPERTLGRRLRDAREDTGMSQAEFAAATGISQRTISRYESATDLAETKRPNLLAWHMATGVPLKWLETGERPDPQSGPGLSLLPQVDSNHQHFDYWSDETANRDSSFAATASAQQAAALRDDLDLAA